MIPGKHGAIIINPTPHTRVIKSRNNRATVIEYGGERYVYQPESLAKSRGNRKRGDG